MMKYFSVFALCLLSFSKSSLAHDACAFHLKHSDLTADERYALNLTEVEYFNYNDLYEELSLVAQTTIDEEAHGHNLSESSIKSKFERYCNETATPSEALSATFKINQDLYKKMLSSAECERGN